MNQPLDRKTAEQMIAALHTINNIENNPDYVKQPDDDIQVKGLRDFLADSFIKHSSEFLGAWIAIATEYEPLVSSFAALQRRAEGLNQLRVEAQQKFAESNSKQPEPEVKSNIIVPKNFMR